MSLWEAGTDRNENEQEAPSTSTSADVCVVGAGIAGLSTAHALLREGRSVVVLDAAAPGSGETARTTAHLVTALDRGWRRIVDVHGAKRARLAAESHARAIDHIEHVARQEGIACDFERVDGYLLAGERGDPAELDGELEAAREAEVAGVEKVGAAPAIALAGPCLRYPRQGQFHPLRYVDGLRRAVTTRGGRIFRNARATRVSGDAPLWVELADGPPIRADAVVIATNTPFNYVVATHTKQAPYRSYAIAIEVAWSLPPTLWWDLEDPFHYVRTYQPREGGRQLAIVGGEDHKTGQAEGDPADRWERLESWARRNVPGLGAVADRWSGQVVESMDGLGFIGRVERGREVFVVTGDSGNGMTHGTIAALLLPDLIQGRPHPWADVYDPTRLRLKALGRFAQENLNVAAKYADYLTRGTATEAAIARNAGAVIRRGLAPVAVYRDADGGVHELSAVCPHLGCIVAWNAAERTWDCPCHGSVFAATGEVRHGPAARGLAPIDRDESAEPHRPPGASSDPPPEGDAKVRGHARAS